MAVFILLLSFHKTITSELDSNSSYPKKWVSSIPEAAGSDETKLLEAFDISFCLSMQTLKRFSSTSRFFSLAMSAVKSNGNPKVSWSLNTISPEIISPVILEIDSSRISIPFSNVSKNLLSSFLITLVISICLLFNSGYAEPINFRSSSTSKYIKGSLAPIL